MTNEVKKTKEKLMADGVRTKTDNAFLGFGRHVNHSIFWKNLAPVKEGGGGPPKGSLGSAIDTHFGSLEGLVKKMNAEDAAVQGSGWVWLGLDKELKKLVVDTTETSNEDPWPNN